MYAVSVSGFDPVTFFDRACSVLAASPHPEARLTVARTPGVTSAVVGFLAFDSVERIRVKALAHPSCPEEVLREAAERSFGSSSGPLSSDVAGIPAAQLRAVAANPNLSADLAFQLADQGSTFVLEGLLSNPSCPPALFNKFLPRKDLSWFLVVAALANPACPTEFLVGAAQGSNIDLLSAVAANPAAPSDVLVVLSQVMGSRGNIAAALASNPSTPADVLARLFTDRVADVGQDLASNPACPPEIFDVLCASDSWVVRSAAARSPQVSTGQLLRFLEDDSFAVRADAASCSSLDTALAPGRVAVLNKVDVAELGSLLLLRFAAVTDGLFAGFAAASADEFVNVSSSSRGLVSQLYVHATGLASYDVAGLQGRFVSGSTADFASLADFVIGKMFSSVVSFGVSNRLFSASQLLTLQKLAAENGRDLSCFSTSVSAVRTPLVKGKGRASNVSIHF